MRAPRNNLLLLALSLAIVPWTAASADQVFLKNGSIVEGKVTEDKARGLVEVKRGNATLSFKLDEVLKIVRDENGAASEGPKPSGDGAASTGAVEAVIIPLLGSFDTYRSAFEFDEILEEALKRSPKMIVFEISSPGGAIVVARHFSRRIRALRSVRTAAFVYGPHNGAYSAAAYVALSCKRIYMAPGQSIGAAVAWRESHDGTPAAVSAKFDSAWQAEFRAAAEANGHPTAIAGAMVSDDDGVAEVAINGKRTYRSALVYTRVRAEGEPKPPGKLLRFVCKPGRVLTLTSQQARRVGISRGTADDTRDFLRRLKILTQPLRLANPLALGRKFIKKEQAKLDRSVAQFNKQFQKLVKQAPGNHTYELDDAGKFKDRGRAWRRRTKASLTYTRRTLKKIGEILKRAKRYPDLQVDRQEVGGYQTRLSALEKELKALRYIEGPP